MLKLTRLKIDKYRNVKPGTELRFSGGFNVLLGQNGTGKTTLLELISMVVRSDFSSLAREEFAIEYEFDLPDDSTTCVRFRNSTSDLPSVPLGSDGRRMQQGEAFQPSVEIEGVFAKGTRRSVVRYDLENGIQIGDESIVRAGAIMSPCEANFSFLFAFLPPADRGALSDALLRSVHAHRFDESLELFKRIVRSKEFPGDVLVFGGLVFPRSDFWASAMVPRAVLDEIGAMYARDPVRRDFVIQSDKLEFLSNLAGMMGFVAAELKLEAIDRRLEKDFERIRLGEMSFRFILEGGDFYAHDRLSYGQKRLLTFYYYLACTDQIVIADELVNGLHHQWIIACIDAIGARQAFLTSQNPLLLDYLPFSSAEQVRSSFVLCRSEKHDNRPRMVWENMSEQDAAEFFSAYEIGVEHVSEILQSRGLW